MAKKAAELILQTALDTNTIEAITKAINDVEQSVEQKNLVLRIVIEGVVQEAVRRGNR